MIFAQLGKAQVNLALLSPFAKIRPLRVNKNMPSAEKAEWHSGVPTFNRTKKLRHISLINLNFNHEKTGKEVLQQRV